MNRLVVEAIEIAAFVGSAFACGAALAALLVYIIGV